MDHMTQKAELAEDLERSTLTSPLLLFFGLLAIIFAVEFLIMFLLPIVMPDAGAVTQNCVDSISLATLIAPFVWLFFVHPLRTLAKTEKAMAEALMECVVDGIVFFNGFGMITSSNPAAKKMFGHVSDDLNGQHIRVLMPDVERFPPGTSLPDILTYMQGPVESTGRRKDGTLFPMDVSISKVRLGGQLVWISIFRDVTEFRRMNRGGLGGRS